MATYGSQSQDQFELVLKATDQATPAIKAVEQSLARLGGLNLSGVGEALKSIAPALDAQASAARTLGTVLDAASTQVRTFTERVQAVGAGGSGTGLAGLDEQIQGLGAAFDAAGSGARTLTGTVDVQLEAQTDAVRGALAQQDALWQQGLAQQEEHIRASQAAQTSLVQAGTAGQRTVMQATMVQQGAVVGAGESALVAATALGEKDRTRAIETGETAAKDVLRSSVAQQEQVVKGAQSTIVAATAQGTKERAAAIESSEDAITEALRRQVAEQEQIIQSGVARIAAQHPMPPSVVEQMVRTQPGEEVPPDVVAHVVDAMKASQTELERMEAAWEARAQAQKELWARMQVPEPRLEDIPGAFPQPSVQAAGGLGGLAGVSLAGVVAPLEELTKVAQAAMAEMGKLADATKAGMAAMADAAKAGMAQVTAAISGGMQAGVRAAQTGSADIVAALDRLGGGTSLADLSAGVKAAMQGAVTAVKDGASEITAALQQLGQGVSLADLSNQLHTISADVADVSRSMPVLTDAVKAGFTSMEDAAAYGTAAVTDAIRTASVEQVEALKEGLVKETEALVEALAKQVEARKEAGAKEVASEKETEGLLSGIRERLEKPLEFAKMFIGWEAGMAAITAMTEAVHELPRAFLEAASEGEAFTTQMQAFYGSAQAAGQVLDYVNAQGLKMPFTVAQIRQAVASLAESGVDPSKALAPLGNIAAAYGTQITDVVAVANRAISTGSSRGLESYLHMTRQQLAAAGVLWDSHGKLIASSVMPALIALGTTRFGDAMARQADTAQGGLVRIANAWDLFKESAGEGLMKGLAGPLKTVTDWITTHQGTIEHWGQVVGNALATIGAKAIWLAQTFGPPILGAISLVVAAWHAAEPAIETAIGAIKVAMDTIGTFLQQQVLPVVYAALGQIVTWWNDNKDQIKKVADAITTGIKTFWDGVSGIFGDALNVIHGIWDVGWGLISGAISLGLDVVTGNWRKFSVDIQNIMKELDIGVLEIMNGLLDALISWTQALGNALKGGIYDATKGLADALYGLTVGVEDAFVKMADKVIGTVNNLGKKLDDMPIFKAVLAAMGVPSVLIDKLGGKTVQIPLLPEPATSGPAYERGQAQWEKTWQQTIPAAVLAAIGVPTIPLKVDTSGIDNYFKRVEQGIARSETGTGAFGTFEDQQKKGKGYLDQFLAWLKKNGIQIPGLTEPGTVTFPTLTGGGGAGGAGGAAAPSDAAQKAVTEANNRFEIFLKHGAPGGWAAGIADIRDIARADYLDHKSKSEITLDVLNRTQELVDKLLTQAQDQFTFDSGVAHPSIKKLHQDETNYLAVLARTPGITPTELANAKRDLDAKISQVTGTTARGAVRDPQAELQLATAHGTLTPALLMRLVPQIIGAERALPAGQRPSDTQIQLDQINAFKSGFGALLQQDQAHFQLDQDNHASAQVLRRDTHQRLADLLAEYKSGAISKTDYLLGQYGINQDLKNALNAGQGQGQAVGAPPAPQYARVSPFAMGAGYGSVLALYGAGAGTRDPNAGVIAELRRVAAYWESRAHHDEQLLAEAKATSQNTRRTADATRILVDKFGNPLPPMGPAMSAGARIKSGGGFLPKHHS